MKIESEIPVVAIDHAAGAAYLTFRNGEVARTEERCNGEPIITLDFDAAGELLGIEVIGAEVLDVAFLERLVEREGRG